jgi:hypothetical protein
MIIYCARHCRKLHLTETMSDYRKALHNGVDAYFLHPYRPLKIVDWLASITD